MSISGRGFSKNNSKRQTFTVTRQLVPEKFRFPQNQFAAIASALASLENFNQVDELNLCLVGVNCRNISIFKGSKANILTFVKVDSLILRLASHPHCTRPPAFKINCTSLALFKLFMVNQLFEVTCFCVRAALQPNEKFSVTSQKLKYLLMQ